MQDPNVNEEPIILESITESSEPPVPNEQFEPEAIFWVFTIQVIYKNGELIRDRNVNVLVTSHAPHITQKVLGTVNQKAQQQVIENNLIPKKAKIIDCVILNVSLLGQMTASKFTGFNPNG